ncbi:MAG: DUF6096 family protein [Oscillospiraceae bacterium]
MIRFTTFKVGNEEYKLRLTSRSIVDIEQKLGKSIFYSLEHIQDNLVGTVTAILWGSMQAFNTGITSEKTFELYDQYIDEGNSVEDMMQVILDLFEVSGFFKKGQKESLTLNQI